MSNIHRIRWIDQQIRNKNYPNCKMIADHFEISVRQASRDIEYMRYSLEAPLEYNHDRQGYCYLNDAFSLPSLFISKEDRDALFYIAQHYQQVESYQARHLADLLLKITGENITGTYSDLPLTNPQLNPGMINKFRELDKALHQKHKVQIKYKSESNDFTVRNIHPYQWMQSMGHLYIIAHCEKRNDIRLFRLDRIRRIILLNETFQISPDFIAGHFKPFQSRSLCKPYLAIIQWQKPISFPDDFQFKLKSLNTCCYEIEFTQSSSLFASLITLQEPFKIIKPSWLLDQFKKFLNKFSEDNF